MNSFSKSGLMYYKSLSNSSSLTLSGSYLFLSLSPDLINRTYPILTTISVPLSFGFFSLFLSLSFSFFVCLTFLVLLYFSPTLNLFLSNNISFPFSYLALSFSVSFTLPLFLCRSFSVSLPFSRNNLSLSLSSW